jgi:hypothetical protein
MDDEDSRKIARVIRRCNSDWSKDIRDCLLFSQTQIPDVVNQLRVALSNVHDAINNPASRDMSEVTLMIESTRKYLKELEKIGADYDGVHEKGVFESARAGDDLFMNHFYQYKRVFTDLQDLFYAARDEEEAENKLTMTPEEFNFYMMAPRRNFLQTDEEYEAETAYFLKKMNETEKRMSEKDDESERDEEDGDDEDVRKAPTSSGNEMKGSSGKSLKHTSSSKRIEGTQPAEDRSDKVMSELALEDTQKLSINDLVKRCFPGGQIEFHLVLSMAISLEANDSPGKGQALSEHLHSLNMESGPTGWIKYVRLTDEIRYVLGKFLSISMYMGGVSMDKHYLLAKLFQVMITQSSLTLTAPQFLTKCMTIALIPEIFDLTKLSAVSIFEAIHDLNVSAQGWSNVTNYLISQKRALGLPDDFMAKFDHENVISARARRSDLGIPKVKYSKMFLNKEDNHFANHWDRHVQLSAKSDYSAKEQLSNNPLMLNQCDYLTQFMNTLGLPDTFADDDENWQFQGFDPRKMVERAVILSQMADGNILEDMYLLILYFKGHGAKVKNGVASLTEVAKHRMLKMISTYKLVDAKPAAPDTITLPRIVACFPAFSMRIYSQSKYVESHGIDKIFKGYPQALMYSAASAILPEQDEQAAKTHLMFCWMLDSVVNKKKSA